MKIAIITDVHGTTYWRYAQKIIDDYDKVVFLGDYFDNWIPQWPEQMDNACNIIAFKKQYPKKIDLCWANHDTSYYLDERCSGFQQEHAKDIKTFFNRHKELFNVVYIYDKWIFSHAGISAKWMSGAGIKTPEEINALFKEKPDFFRWVGPNGYGDNPNEGPLWIRPNSLMNNAVKNYDQAVGHSELQDGPKVIIKNAQKFVFTDTREHNHFTFIDTKTNDVDFSEIKAN